MSRLIDADALEKELEKMTQDFLNDKTIQGDFSAGVTVETLEEVRKAPTVYAAPVVRCGECRHGKPDIMSEDYTACNFRCTVMPNDGYCSYGERKAEVKT